MNNTQSKQTFAVTWSIQGSWYIKGRIPTFMLTPWVTQRKHQPGVGDIMMEGPNTYQIPMEIKSWIRPDNGQTSTN